MSIKKHEQKLLTEAELDLMTEIWRLKECTVHDVVEAKKNDRKLAYTTVSTILRILEQKKVLGSKKAGRGHIYFPLLEKEAYEAKTLDHVVDKVFAGAPSMLVKRLISDHKLSPQDLSEIKKMLEENEGKK